MKFIGQGQRGVIGERQEIEEVQLGVFERILRDGRVLPLVGKLRLDPREIETSRHPCALTLLNEPEQIGHDGLVRLMHLHHAHGLQALHIAERHAGHRIELPAIGLRLADMEHFAGGAPALDQTDAEEILRRTDPRIENTEGIGSDRVESEGSSKLGLPGLPNGR